MRYLLYGKLPASFQRREHAERLRFPHGEKLLLVRGSPFEDERAGLCGEVAFFERERIEIKDTVLFPIENVDVRGIMLPAEKIHLHDDPIKSGDYRHDIASFRF
jgi:hypothetical protein